MQLQNKIATVFGGTGFIGRYIIAQLAREGATIKVVTRHPSSAYFLRQFGGVGQIVPVLNDLSPESIERVIAGSDVVVNCMGILFEKRKSKFKTVHEDYARQIAQACAKYNVKRLVHISAAGIDKSQSQYAQTKRAGEAAIRAAFPKATILRPCVVFGAEDNFFNKFAQLSMFSPVLPLIGGGHTKFQPVYVCDVAQAAVNALTETDIGAQSPLGKTYDLAGPETLDFKGIYQKIAAVTGRKRILLSLPVFLARIQAALFSVLPTPPLTNDQITSLKTDNVADASAPGLADLAIQPTALDAVLPTYLDHYRSGGRFADRKRA